MAAARREYQSPLMESQAPVSWIWDIHHSGPKSQLTPPPPLTSIIPYSQPSSLACLSGRWLTGASRGSSACCWAPSGSSSARWCWPGASAGSPATYPETAGERARGKTRQGERRGNALAGCPHPFQQRRSHQHVWYAWLKGRDVNVMWTLLLTREYASVL